MAADGLGPAAQDGFEPVGQVFGFFGVRHQGHARGKFGLALDQGAAKLQGLFQHAADGRCQAARRLERDGRRPALPSTGSGERVSSASVPFSAGGDFPSPWRAHSVRCPAGVPGPGFTGADQSRLGRRFRGRSLGCRPARIVQRPARCSLEGLQHVGQAGHGGAGAFRGTGGGLGIEPESRRRGLVLATGRSWGDGERGLAFRPWPIQNALAFRCGLCGQWGICRQQAHRFSRFRPCYATVASSMTGKI